MPPRVVVADDNPAMLESVCRLLAGDFEIVAAVKDGQATLDAVATLRPDAVVLDISMPRLNGLEAAKRLSAMPDPPPIVLLTVNESAELVAAARDAGVLAYVFKRNAGRDLIVALNKALRGESTFPATAPQSDTRLRLKP